jgi:hypothetical protein
MPGSDDAKNEEVDPPDCIHDTAREEARTVVSEQLQTLRDTDQKAMATARINGLILGVLASAASFTDNPSGIVNIWIVFGGATLLCSLCISVLTYTVDRPSYGVGPGYFDTILADLETKEQAQNDILARYADWIEDNSDDIETNSTYLLASQLFFIIGLILLGVGVYTFL